MPEKSPQQLYDERMKRVLDAAALRVPDRVPVFGPYQKYPYAFAGVTLKQAMNDYECARTVCHKFVDHFQPDLDFGPIFTYPAPAMDILGWKAFAWPGHGLGDDIMYQYVDGEYMKAEEYDEFIQDPSDFMLRTWAPRQFSALEGFSKMVPWRRFMWSGWMSLDFFASPEMRRTLDLAVRAGEEMKRWWDSQSQYKDETKAKGYPLAFAGWDWPPFDILGDTLRGTHQILADMRRRPGKLHDALEVATRIFVEYGSGAAGEPLPLVWVWVHKSTREFMSDAQFKEFYWPYFRRGLLALVEKGVIPVVYWEADFESRLPHIVDVPKGKIIYHLSNTNAEKARDVLGGTVCLMGNVPNIMLLSGTPHDVRAYCRKLIDHLGKGGGFIMDSALMLDEAKPENLKAMIDFTKDYGAYR
ncbi:MAG TPA: uroporphyrinogen decarboxylase family protein [Spirochaetia bacterium]|nr:uroporphyrinogen decarboxylase family protein [Spirochaetia bacterium]